MDWKVRRAEPHDVPGIVRLSLDNFDVLIPYTAELVTTRGYIDQFLVAEGAEREEKNTFIVLGGAVHFVPNDNSDMSNCFLHYVKQVPDDIIVSFTCPVGEYKKVMIGQVVCPGKGSFYAILEEAKKQFDEIWCYMSIAGPSYFSYIRYGFELNLADVREFWNVYKLDYSKFVLGKWIKGG